MTVQQSEIRLLHCIRQLPGAKPDVFSKPHLVNHAIQGVSGDNQGVFVWFVNGYERYELEELTLPELTLLQQFMLRRLSDPVRELLAGVQHRKRLQGKSVIFQHSTFTPQVLGQLVSHAIDDRRPQLGDCWLVRSTQRQQYLPAQHLYLAPQYGNVTMFPIIH